MSTIEIDCIQDARAEVGEGIIWDEGHRALFWVDITPGRLWRLDPISGATRSWDLSEPLGCMAIMADGRAILALRSGFWALDLESGAKQRLRDLEPDRPGNRPNDGTTDPVGRFWVGTMKMNQPPERTGAFYRLDADLSCRRMVDQWFTTNGLAFSPDGRTMYLSDSNPEVRTIWALDYDLATGQPTNRRLFFDTRAVAGRPDGGTVDAEGYYWMAGVGGWQVLRLDPKGRVDRIIPMPIERPSRPAFGGPGLDELFVTSLGVGLTPGREAEQPQAGSVFRIRGLGVKGIPAPRYAG